MRPSWSSCAISPAWPFPKWRRRSTCLRVPPTGCGPTRGPGCGGRSAAHSSRFEVGRQNLGAIAAPTALGKADELEELAVMNERTVFIEALDITDPWERSAFLERACAGDA